MDILFPRTTWWEIAVDSAIPGYLASGTKNNLKWWIRASMSSFILLRAGDATLWLSNITGPGFSLNHCTHCLIIRLDWLISSLLCVVELPHLVDSHVLLFFCFCCFDWCATPWIRLLRAHHLRVHFIRIRVPRLATLLLFCWRTASSRSRLPAKTQELFW